MAGYTRVDTINNIADGNVINAADLDGEFDGVQSAFNSSTGHNHDGTAGEGAPILALGPAQNVTISASVLGVATTNTVDIGTSSLKFKDFYLAGAASVGGTLGVTGVATLTAQPILSSLTASQAVFTDASKGLVSNAITGTGNVVMSTSPTLVTPALGTPSSGVVTNLTGTASININGTVGATTASTGAFTTLTSNGATTFTAGTASTTTGTGTLVITGGLGVSGRINAANFDGIVGANTAAAGAFTTLSASSTLTVTDAGSIQGLTVGRGAGAVATNTAVGASALAANTSGTHSTAVGVSALQANSSGTYNTAVGLQALLSNTTGATNSAFGFNSLSANTTGANNVAVGVQALTSNTTASGNTAVGYQSMYTNTGSANSVAVGYQSLYSITGNSGNVAIGYRSQYLTTGGENTSAGYISLAANTTGAFNTAFGHSALQANTTASENTAVGYQAAYSNTTGAGGTAMGRRSMYSNTTGANNSAFGLNALYANTTGANNTAIGYAAMESNTTGGTNTAVGFQAGFNITTGSTNTALGVQALQTVTSGGDNVAVGRIALRDSTGTANTACGEGAGAAMTTGNYNTFLGRYTGNSGGFDMRTNSNYVVLSDGQANIRGVFDNNGTFFVGKYESSATDEGWQIGYDGKGGAVFTQVGSNEIFVWNNVVTNGTAVIDFRTANTSKGRINWDNSSTSYNTTSDYRLKENVQPMTGALAKVSLLKPCTYTWKDGGNSGQGFIAHELGEVVPECVTGEKDAVDENGAIKPQGIDTSFLVATLTAAIQELKAEFDAYKATHP